MGDLRTSAQSGTYREQLIALRDHLADLLEVTTSARETAPLAKQYADVLRELNDLPDESGTSTADEIAARRAQRQAQAQATDA